MFNIIGSETSIHNIYKILKADGREVQAPTIENYLNAPLDRIDDHYPKFLLTLDYLAAAPKGIKWL
jgi:hypothetical protein